MRIVYLKTDRAAESYEYKLNVEPQSLMFGNTVNVKVMRAKIGDTINLGF